jgi:proton-translocating NADH-quinone oxidoreductase chain N
MNMAHDLGLLLPEIAVLLTGVVTLVTGMVGKPRWALPVTIAGLVVAIALTTLLLDIDTTVFMGTFRIDDLSLWAKLILLPATGLVALLVLPEVRGTDREATVFGLLSFTTFGALALAGAGDLMFLVLGVLLTGLGAFGLVAYPRTDRATEAAMKYFVFGAASSAVMTYGLTFWFGAAGSTLIADLGRLADARLALASGLVGVLIGLGYKAALAPFHFWAPDAYDGAPLAVAAYLSVVTKVGAVFGLAQVARSLPINALDWRVVVALLATVSMTYGNLAALPQTNLVRLLAYSSIAQAGYFLLGVVGLGTSDLAVRSLIVFGTAYGAMNLGAFAVVAMVGRDLSAFSGLGRASPLVGMAMVVFLLSLVGLPPLAGFFGKLLLFGATIDAGYTWLAVVGILNSVLSLAVYLRIIVPMYVQAPTRLCVTRPVTVVLVTTFLLTVAVGLGAEALVRG